MSTLKVTNIQATGETVSRSVSGVAAAWAMVNASGLPSIQESSNISSLADTANGVTTFAYSNNMSTATYAAYGTIRRTDDNSVNAYYTGYHLPTASDVRFTVSDYNGTETDNGYISMSVLGDLA